METRKGDADDIASLRLTSRRSALAYSPPLFRASCISEDEAPWVYSLLVML